jgi:hypothetical protein
VFFYIFICWVLVLIISCLCIISDDSEAFVTQIVLPHFLVLFTSQNPLLNRRLLLCDTLDLFPSNALHFINGYYIALPFCVRRFIVLTLCNLYYFIIFSWDQIFLVWFFIYLEIWISKTNFGVDCVSMLKLRQLLMFPYPSLHCRKCWRMEWELKHTKTLFFRINFYSRIK